MSISPNFWRSVASSFSRTPRARCRSVECGSPSKALSLRKTSSGSDSSKLRWAVADPLGLFLDLRAELPFPLKQWHQLQRLVESLILELPRLFFELGQLCDLRFDLVLLFQRLGKLLTVVPKLPVSRVELSLIHCAIRQEPVQHSGQSIGTLRQFVYLVLTVDLHTGEQVSARDEGGTRCPARR